VSVESSACVQVCDLTAWVENHPGGYLALVNIAGKDATDNFTVYHPAYVWERKLPYMVIGELPEHEKQPSAFVKEYRAINQQLLENSA
jgi:cytochrome b involved in lipid metabolism